MKAFEIMEKAFEYGKDFNYVETCDTLKAGSPEKEVKKLAVAMNPTVSVIRNAHEWGADMLIVHEPMYFNHMDVHSDEDVENEKRAFVESTGMTIYRFHDHPHREKEDMIAKGEFALLGLEGEYDYTGIFDLVRLKLAKPMSPVELAKYIEDKLGIKHVRIAGTRDEKCTNVSSYFGAPGDVFDELSRPETEILLMGETCEWRLCEYARDASLLGRKKAILVLGHVGSERAGMVYFTELLKKSLPDLEIEYFDTDEVYTYTD